MFFVFSGHSPEAAKVSSVPSYVTLLAHKGIVSVKQATAHKEREHCLLPLILQRKLPGVRTRHPCEKIDDPFTA